MRNTYIIIAFLISIGIQAQLQTTHWYFGNRAGLNFSSGISVNDPQGLINSMEGCASISDECGNLLFYTDGIKVYTRNHNAVMPNGYPLYGHSSSSQASVIVPNPGNANIYYIFTVDGGDGVYGPYETTNKGMNYSIVDMSLNGGNGEVIQRNVPLALLNGKQKSSEKLTAVKMADGSGYWVLTHFVDSYYAFKVTANGVDSQPVVSKIGVYIHQDDHNENGEFVGEIDRGCIKISPDGTKIAVAHDIGGPYTSGLRGALAVYNFDNVTGIVSNQLLYDDSFSYYGVEFSPDSQILYATFFNDTENFLAQYDLSANSKYIIASNAGLNTIQLGLDNKIYCAKEFKPYLSIIHNPNEFYNPMNGDNPDFELDGIYVGETGGQGRSRLGLPNFVSSFFTNGVYFNGKFLVNGNEEGAIKYCVNEELMFTPDICGLTIENYAWDFGDGTTSTLQNPLHTYTNIGIYTVTLIVTASGGQSNTFTMQIEIVPPPAVQNAELKECLDLNGAEVEFDLTES
ncbi:PKD domain-containing protein, partial [Moheibacter sediminis]